MTTGPGEVNLMTTATAAMSGAQTRMRSAAVTMSNPRLAPLCQPRGPSGRAMNRTPRHWANSAGCHTVNVLGAIEADPTDVAICSVGHLMGPVLSLRQRATLPATQTCYSPRYGTTSTAAGRWPTPDFVDSRPM